MHTRIMLKLFIPNTSQYSQSPSQLYSITAAVAISLLATNYSTTEGDGSVEVCLQVIVGTVKQVAFVDVQTAELSASGEYQY